MDMRLCPKCKAKNWPDKAHCAICGESLAGVPLTDVSGGRQPQQAAQQPQPVQQPAQAQSGPMGPMNFPGAPTQQAYSRPAPQVQEKPESKVPLILAGLIVIGMLGAGLWALIPRKEPIPTAPPEKTVSAFLEARGSTELSKIEPFFSEESLQYLRNAGDKALAKSTAFSTDPSVKLVSESNITYKVTTTPEDKEKGRAIVEVTAIDKRPSLLVMPVVCEYVLVPEGGKWKIDLSATRRRQSSSSIDNLVNPPM